MDGPSPWLSGLTLVLAAGAMQGAFPLPMRFTRVWEWENIWFVSSLAGLVLLPWGIAFYTVPHLLSALAAVPVRAVALVALFGAGWGVGGLLFGLGVHRVGLSLTTAVVIGLTSTVGSLLPLALWNPDEFGRQAGLLALGSVSMTIAGLLLCSAAGYIRERTGHDLYFRRGSYWSGVVICILSGLLSPLFNFALICGAPLVRAAEALGARAADGPNLVLAVAMTAGMIPTTAYCGWLMRRRATLNRFAQNGTAFDGGLALVMGMLFAFGNSLYGAGAETMGPLGPALGWPVFMAVQVVTGNLLAFLTGEWKGSSGRAFTPLIIGNAALIGAVCLVAPLNK
jgi:L-rhamnose-H+ transport protein